MNSHIKNILNDDEVVQWQGYLHWIDYLIVFFTMLLLIILSGEITDPIIKSFANLAIIVVTCGQMVGVLMKHWSTELVVTDQRIIARTGLIARETNDIDRAAIEGVDVKQGIVGRLVGFGTVSVRGADGVIAPVHRVNDPTGVCKAIQAG
jgi:uncharacterized membrane protein YdbT with pleckstrin-like domain